MTSALKHAANIRVSNVDKKSVEGEMPVQVINYTDVYYGNRLGPGPDLKRATATAQQLADFRLRPGDVLITKDSESADDIGVAAYVEETASDLVCGYHLAMLRPRPTTDGRFLFWAVSSLPTQRQFETSATGVTRYGLRSDAIGGTTISLPPLAEQRAIADYLDAETARIDALIAKKQQLIHLLEERATALVDDLAEPRSGERMTRLARLAQIRSGVTLNSNVEPEGAVLMPYLRVANVQPGFLDLNEVKEVAVAAHVGKRCALRAGDVLMTEGGDIDKLGRGTVWRAEIEPCLHQNHVFAVRPKPGAVVSDYLALYTRTSHARSYFESTGVQSTNLASTNSAKVGDLRIPALTPGEQRDRVSEYGRRSMPIEASIQQLTRQISLLVERRQALITAAVTGKLAVPGAP